MSTSYGGSCLCGAVGFQVDGFASDIGHCHCSMCRKFHGAAFATIASVKGFRWLRGEETLASFTADNGTTRHVLLDLRVFADVLEPARGERPRGGRVGRVRR